MQEISYTLSRGETRIVVGRGSNNLLGKLPDDSIVVYPDSVSGITEDLFGKSKKILHKIRDGEEGKSIDSVLEIVEEMRGNRFKRSSTLISIGGGSTSDAAGMAASLYMRGINYVSVPTTLLSMVDASLGGKNAVNYHGVKNLLGSFFNPSLTIIDTSFISDMPESVLTDGLGEIAKYALILDSGLYEVLINDTVSKLFSDEHALETTIIRCVKDKMDIVAEDEFDLLGKRVVLNFGHTIGHALEGASDFSISHGKAVAMGMIMEIDMGIRLGLVSKGMMNHAAELLQHLGLPYNIDEEFMRSASDRMVTLLLSDKKASGNSISIPFPESAGRAKVSEVELKYISDYLEQFT